MVIERDRWGETRSGENLWSPCDTPGLLYHWRRYPAQCNHCATPFHGVFYQSVVYTDGVFARAYIARLHSRISAVTKIQLPEPAALGDQKPTT